MEEEFKVVSLSLQLQKLTKKWIKDLNLAAKTIKLSEENR